MSESRFGILYAITRIVLVVLILLMIIINIVHIAQSNQKTEDIVWVVFSFISLAIGLIGVWREHFLFSCTFAVILLVLACVSGAYGFIWLQTTGTVILILLAMLFTFMLWDMGNRQMNVPDMC